MRNCRKCGTEITKKNPGHPAKFCNQECRRLFFKKLPDFTECLFCHKPLRFERTAGQPRRYCDRKCAANLRVAMLREKRKFERPCAWCSKPFVGVSARVKYCSEDCRLANNRTLAALRWEAEKAARPETKSWICQWCGGDVVVHISFTGYGKFHPECRKQADRAQNRKKTLLQQKVRTGLVVTHEQIAERDNFICHICNELVDMSLPRTSRMGATLDHVVPISRGGLDELENLKLAHWFCNVSKNNKLMEELNV